MLVKSQIFSHHQDTKHHFDHCFDQVCHFWQLQVVLAVTGKIPFSQQKHGPDFQIRHSNNTNMQFFFTYKYKYLIFLNTSNNTGFWFFFSNKNIYHICICKVYKYVYSLSPSSQNTSILVLLYPCKIMRAILSFSLISIYWGRRTTPILRHPAAMTDVIDKKPIFVKLLAQSILSFIWNDEIIIT